MSRGVRILRRSTQTSVLIFLVLVPALVWYGTHGSPGTAHERVDLDGDTWSLHLFGLSVLDPLAGAEALVSGNASLRLVLAAIALPILLTALLGRVFCSWICPAGFVFEMTDHLRRTLSRFGLSPGSTRFWRGHKYVLLLAGLVMSALVGLPLLSHFYPPALVAREIHATVLDGLGGNVAVTGATLLLFGIILIEVLASRRVWCRSLCPGGAIYSLVGGSRAVRVRRTPRRCTDCGDCIAACPMGLDPMRDRTGLECDNCQECISHCPEDALKLAIAFRDGPVVEGRP